MIRGREMANQYKEALQAYHSKAFGHAFVNNTAQLLGVREGRRILGDYVLTLDDFKARRQFPDRLDVTAIMWTFIFLVLRVCIMGKVNHMVFLIGY